MEVGGALLLWLVKVELLVVVDELDGVELLTVVLVVLSAGGPPPLELQPASPAASNNDATALIIGVFPLKWPLQLSGEFVYVSES